MLLVATRGSETGQQVLGVYHLPSHLDDGTPLTPLTPLTPPFTVSPPGGVSLGSWTPLCHLQLQSAWKWTFPSVLSSSGS